MAKKTKTITVRGKVPLANDQVGKPTGYRIDKVTDSLEFAPGTLMTERQVQDLCDRNDWKVTILPV